MPTQNQIREQITQQIVNHLTAGKVAPWRRPWSLDRNAGAPANVVSKKTYRGINPLLLQIAAMRHGFRSKWWATWNQWKALGGSVMRRPDNVPPGKWGTTIVFWSRITKSKSDDDEEESYFLLKSYTVFCIDQVEADHLDHLRVGNGQLDAQEVQERFQAADRAIDATGADIRHGGNQACYNPVGDFILVPQPQQFQGGEYYETLMHELSHWTEHPTRLNWDRSKPENTYALGELIAELGGCFIASELGLPTTEKLNNHVSYLQNWLAAMQGDPRFIFRAAAQAAKCADFILSFSRTEAEEREPAIII